MQTTIWTIFVTHTMVLAADLGWPGEVSDALSHSGGNCCELETALRKVKGKDTELLIAQASQCDLVNLVAGQIAENV